LTAMMNQVVVTGSRSHLNLKRSGRFIHLSRMIESQNVAVFKVTLMYNDSLFFFYCSSLILLITFVGIWCGIEMMLQMCLRSTAVFNSWLGMFTCIACYNANGVQAEL
jgi:hypothetical protein